jgi:ABC-type transport system substrate-binding protein
VVEADLIDPFGPSAGDPSDAGRPSRRRRILLGLLSALVALAMVARLWPAPAATSPVVAAANPGSVTILAAEPLSIDPAHHGDLGSATVVSQLFESLTAVDSSLTVRPALAASWAVQDAGRRVVFTLRDSLTFSDSNSWLTTVALPRSP